MVKPGDRVLYYRRKKGGIFGPFDKIPCVVIKLGRVRVTVEFQDGSKLRVNYDNIQKVRDEANQRGCNNSFKND